MKFSITLLKITIFLFFFISCEEQDNPIEKQNNPPLVSNQTFEIEENSPTGTLVGILAASDLDGDMLNYELLDIEGVPFEIESNSGKILVKDQALLDYESKVKYTFLVKVTYRNTRPLNNIVVITIEIKNKSEIPISNLIAYYPFNGNANDIGSNNLDGDPVSVTATSDRKGLEGGAFSFNGYSSYINLNNKAGSGVRSISMWFNLDINIDNQLYNPMTLLTRDGPTDNRNLFDLVFVPNGWVGDAGKLRFKYSRSLEDIYFIQSNSNFWRKGIWHHVVITIDPSKGMMMYIDNVKQQAVSPFYEATDDTDLDLINVYVGNYSPNSNRNFNGKIDDLLIFNKELTEDEIDELYKQ